MRKFPLLAGLLSLLLGGSVVFASTSKRLPDQSDHSFLFCLKPMVQPLHLNRSVEPVDCGVSELNQFFQNNDIIQIEQWISSADEKDHDGDIYSNRIYRVYIRENHQGDLERIKEKLASLSMILSTEFENLDRVDYTPNDTRYYQQCSLPAVKADQAWNYFVDAGVPIGNRSVLLASVDTGVDITHPDLENNIWVNQPEVPSSIFSDVDADSDGTVTSTEILSYLSLNNLDLNSDGTIDLEDAVQSSSPFIDNTDDDSDGFTDDVIGWDLAGISGADDNNPMPKPGVATTSTWAHGTHVGGILAATSDNNYGIASTAFNASLMPVKCSRENQSGEPFITDGYSGLIYAAKAGYYAGTFTIINLSWGGGGFSSYEQSQINIAHDTYGAVIVAAAGNGIQTPPYGEEYAVHYPSSYDNVISVAAIGCSGTWGHWATYHESVDLSAPGEGVLSTIIGTGYASWDGSSMASPNAASCIGLLKAFYPTWTNVELENRITETADPFIYDVNTDDYLQGRLGTGMVDINNAIGAGYLPLLSYYTHTYIWVNDDGDGVLNPGESVELRVLLQNEQGRAVAQNVVGTLRSGTAGVVITDSTAVYPDINPGAFGVNISDTYALTVLSGISLGDIHFDLHVEATGEAGAEYSEDISFTDQVTLNQAGWPIENAPQIEASPIVWDIDGDGNQDILYGDYNGDLHRVNKYGEEADGFPFSTGDDIWGSPAIADIDHDGDMEIVVTSKSKHLYILNTDGSVQADYNAGQYLMGTPAIGNMDDDNDLEIVVGGYISSGKIFAINPDGTDVQGFPIDIGEKIQRGLALSDLNNNGKDEIIFGTDSDHLWMVPDNGDTSQGWIFPVGSDIRSAPSVAAIAGNTIIFVGSRDDQFYAVNSDGTLRFSAATGGDVMTSAAIVNMTDSLDIFFGSNDGLIYGVNTDGDALPGWPIDLGSPITSSPVIADMDSDGNPDVAVVSNNGKIAIFHSDGSPFNNFPYESNLSINGNPTIADVDGDGDLELLLGYSTGLLCLDIKTAGSTESYWFTHRKNYQRTGDMNSPVVGVTPDIPSVPVSLGLSAAYPNPFNPSTEMKIDLPVNAMVDLAVYNLIGQRVLTLMKGEIPAGRYTRRWNAGQEFASGVYFIRLTSISNGRVKSITRKVLLLK